jgi:hypothetical protein
LPIPAEFVARKLRPIGDVVEKQAEGIFSQAVSRDRFERARL